MPIHRAIGNAAAITFPISFVAVTTYALAPQPQECAATCLGYVYLPAVCTTGIAAVLFAPIGSALAHSLPVPALKRVFASLLVLFALNLGRKALPSPPSLASAATRAIAAMKPDLGLCQNRTSLRPKPFRANPRQE